MGRFKIVYYDAPSSDTVYIRDIWDTRMSPETLKRRIKQLLFSRFFKKNSESLGGSDFC